MSSHTDRSILRFHGICVVVSCNTVLFVLDSRRFERTCNIRLQPLKIMAIRLFGTSEIYDPVTRCNTPEDLNYNRDAFRLHLHFRHYFSVSRPCQGCFFTALLPFRSLKLAVQAVCLHFPSVFGRSRASVVSKRITRRRYKRRWVKEQGRERVYEDILNGKLNNSKHFIKDQTSYFPLLHLRLCTLLLHLSNLPRVP